jgi:hypothetical protein
MQQAATAPEILDFMGTVSVVRLALDLSEC